jgi:predicted mannosyl-3-phosphoglycerate phosphatase (HAD superfamily)
MDVAKLEDELIEIRKRLKRLEDISGITHFCDLRDEETEREFLGFLSGVSEASERTISETIRVDLADIRCYTASLLYRDMISVASVESEVHDGYATSVIRKLGITDKGRGYLTEISK